MSTNPRFLRSFLIAFVALSALNIDIALADGSKELVSQSRAALEKLYAKAPKAKQIEEKSAGVLVFPDIVRAGLVVGGSGGKGVLFKKGKTAAYYQSGSVSVGLQAGIQSFGYAVFFTTEPALKAFENSEGWDIGTAPTVVVVDSGLARELDTTTLKSDVYAFTFDQKGLMAGIALKGQKITKLK